jgi:hypothetical protein
MLGGSMGGSMVHPPIDPREENLMIKERNVFFLALVIT